MNSAAAAQPTLAAVLWPPHVAVPVLRSTALILLGTVLLWLSAKIQIPLQPVPVTLQTLVVLTLGVAYGWRLAVATTLLYLAVGAAGLPVFAGTWSQGGGFHHLYGPTAGYLVGFVLAAAFVGGLAERGWDRNVLTATVAMILGNLVIYVLGVGWLAAQIGLIPALQFGLLPFLVGDALKVALGAGLLPLTWRLLGRDKPRREI